VGGKLNLSTIFFGKNASINDRTLYSLLYLQIDYNVLVFFTSHSKLRGGGDKYFLKQFWETYFEKR
jgi:hypothetical protein